MLAREGYWSILAPETQDQLQRLTHARVADPTILLPGEIIGLELGASIAGIGEEDEPAIAEHVEGRRHLGQQGRVAKGRA